jgi:hypothetical protein
MANSATLIAGSRGAKHVTRAELVEYIPPPATETWKPIAHAELVDTLHEVMSYRGMFITKDDYVIDKGGSRMFGTFDLEWMKMEEYGAAVGFRHATDKSMSIQIAVGARVFVCSNMSFKAELISVRKHTSKLNLTEEMDKAMFRYQQGFRLLQDDIHVQKNTPVDHEHGKALIYDIFRAKIVPVKLFHPICNEWETLRTSEFMLNAWHLHNAVTAHIKTLQPAPAFTATARLAKFFAAKF